MVVHGCSSVTRPKIDESHRLIVILAVVMSISRADYTAPHRYLSYLRSAFTPSVLVT